MSILRDIRVTPVILAAIIGLAVLKVSGLLIDGGYVLGGSDTAQTGQQTGKLSWAQDMFSFPGGKRVAEDTDDVTGSVSAKKEDAKPEAAKVETTRPVEPLPQPNEPVVSSAERAVLERLQARRQELDARAREIEIRENLLKAAEKRNEARVEEMKAIEARITTATEQKEQADTNRLKGIVTMYEGMRAKDAARIFDRLDMAVLIQVATQIAPRKMADILGQMQPEAAERLTIEMARRASGDKIPMGGDLPKIEGRPQAH